MYQYFFSIEIPEIILDCTHGIRKVKSHWILGKNVIYLSSCRPIFRETKEQFLQDSDVQQKIVSLSNYRTIRT